MLFLKVKQIVYSIFPSKCRSLQLLWPITFHRKHMHVGFPDYVFMWVLLDQKVPKVKCSSIFSIGMVTCHLRWEVRLTIFYLVVRDFIRNFHKKWQTADFVGNVIISRCIKSYYNLNSICSYFDAKNSFYLLKFLSSN